MAQQAEPGKPAPEEGSLSEAKKRERLIEAINDYFGQGPDLRAPTISTPEISAPEIRSPDRAELPSIGETLLPVIEETVRGLSLESRGGLTQAEEAIFAQIGAEPLDAIDSLRFDMINELPMLDRFQANRSLTFSAEEVATNLGVSDSRIRQKVSDGTLYSFEYEGKRRFPKYQFNNQGMVKTWVARVMPKVDRDLHPEAVRHFFNTPNPELQIHEEAGFVAPIAWLASGGSPEAVIELLRDL